MIKELNDVHKKIMNYYDEALSEYNLSYMQALMLKEIYLHDDEVNSKAVEVLTKQNKRLVSINLNKLETLHYIERIEDETDKRNKVIIVTDYGLTICEELINLDEELEQLLQENLSVEQYNNIICLLEQILMDSHD